MSLGAGALKAAASSRQAALVICRCRVVLTANDIPGQSSILLSHSHSAYWGITESIWIHDYPVQRGTTLILIATDAFNVYKSSTGGVADAATGLLRNTSFQYSSLNTLGFKFSVLVHFNTILMLKVGRVTAISGSTNSMYLVVVGFINEYTFLERFDTIFDTDNHRVGCATTSYTTASSNYYDRVSKMRETFAAGYRHDTPLRKGRFTFLSIVGICLTPFKALTFNSVLFAILLPFLT
ncbi:hypothetical protein APHAL10511_002420 [Amanita phalloides]|nr:hypothetical protein APHAL10511_002420 [Amanita phalloides]